MDANRDILRRLGLLGVRYYITGAEALGVWAEPRQTRDMDIVLELDRSGYEARLRPAFVDAYLVNDVIDSGGHAMGGVIHTMELARADLVLSRRDPWSRAALDRRRELDDPVLGTTWFISPEDLVLAKLLWSDGGSSERQVRDVTSILRTGPDLDWMYLRRYAPEVGVVDLLERLRVGR